MEEGRFIESRKIQKQFVIDLSPSIREEGGRHVLSDLLFLALVLHYNWKAWNSMLS